MATLDVRMAVGARRPLARGGGRAEAGDGERVSLELDVAEFAAARVERLPSAVWPLAAGGARKPKFAAAISRPPRSRGSSPVSIPKR